MTDQEALAKRAWDASRQHPVDGTWELYTPEFRTRMLAFAAALLSEPQAWESSDAGVVQRFVEDQSNWERRERLGANELVARVQHRAELLGRWLGMPITLAWIDDARTRLRESVEALLEVRTDQERSQELAILDAAEREQRGTELTVVITCPECDYVGLATIPSGETDD